MATESVDTSRTTVKTYIPAYQRDAWDAHADDLGMSRSEYVRTMVQAGRRYFDVEESTDEAADGTQRESHAMTQGEKESQDESGESVETIVIQALQGAEYLSWDELLEALTEDLETRLEETLQALQADDRVRYSGPNGGYTLDR